MNSTSGTTTRITFKTTDGVSIVGDYCAPSNAKKVVLLLHMMPAVRQSYAPLSTALNKAGVATLAIDLRGHGESIERQVYKQEKPTILDHKKFAPEDHQTSRLDVDASLNFLKSSGFAENGISFVGASIGANLALDALDRYDNSHCAVLLSPGLDYRGVLAEPALKGITKAQTVWAIAANEDEYSAEAVKVLEKLNPTQVKATIFDDENHGTDLFAAHPNLIKEIVDFI